MPHDVFLAYSSNDQDTADAACAALERHGVRVWMAPRDIVPGADWPASIIAAINGARAMVLIFSSHANDSPQVKREVERAVNKRIPVIPFRIENVLPSETLEYLISAPHWLDAFTPGLEGHLVRLADAARRLLESAPAGEGGTRRDAVPPPAAPATPRPAEPQATGPAVRDGAPANGADDARPAQRVWMKAPWALGAAIAVVIVALAGLWHLSSSSAPASGAPANAADPRESVGASPSLSADASPIDRRLAEIRRQPLLGYNLEALPEAERTITIAVLSTGVSPEMSKALGSRLQASSAVPGEPDPEDLNGQGTSSVALLAALAPSAKLHAIKIYSARGAGLARPGEDGVRKAIADRADVIFMDCCGATASDGVAAAVQAAVRAGALVIAPAGNQGGTQIALPAAFEGVLAVGSLGPEGRPAPFTNRAADVLFAPGVDIATIDDRTAPTLQSGTSVSATIASAIAAVVWAGKPRWSAQQIRALLADTAVDLGPLDSGTPQAGRIRRLDLAAATAVPADAIDSARDECARECRRAFSDCNMGTVNDRTSAARDACRARLEACQAACSAR